MPHPKSLKTAPEKHAAAPIGSLHIGRLQRVDLVQRVVTRLEEEILSGRLTASHPLPPEGQLSLQLGVSRTVVREAMRILGAKGLVVVSRGKLPRVCPADPSHVFDSITTFLQRANHSLLHLGEVRRHLETAIAALAAERATLEQIAAMEEVNQELAAAKTLDQRIEADMRFHTLLAEATGNPVFGLLLEPLTHLLRLSLKETLGRVGSERAVHCHQSIIEAVRQRNPEGARQAILELVAKAEQDMGVG